MDAAKLISGAVLLFGFASVGSAAELQADTLNAWEEYMHDREPQVHERVTGKMPFLWVDDSPERAARLKRGEIIVAPVVGHGTRSVPNGLIHDWIGAVFVPHTKLAGVLNVANNFDRYQAIYRPLVVKSTTIFCTEQEQEYSMVWRHHVLTIDAAAQGRYQVHFHAVDSRRAYGITESVEIQEIQHFGEPDQRLLAPDTGNGVIWRIRSVARYEERDGGVYLELEVMALTRDVPSSIRWIVCPIINHLSINSLKDTLRQTRDAVGSSAEGGNPACPAPQTNGVNVISANRSAVPSKAQESR